MPKLGRAFILACLKYQLLCLFKNTCDGFIVIACKFSDTFTGINELAANGAVADNLCVILSVCSSVLDEGHDERLPAKPVK